MEELFAHFWDFNADIVDLLSVYVLCQDLVKLGFGVSHVKIMFVASGISRIHIIIIFLADRVKLSVPLTQIDPLLPLNLIHLSLKIFESLKFLTL